MTVPYLVQEPLCQAKSWDEGGTSTIRRAERCPISNRAPAMFRKLAKELMVDGHLLFFWQGQDQRFLDNQ
jgi:hypothetical protein